LEQSGVVTGNGYGFVMFTIEKPIMVMWVRGWRKRWQRCIYCWFSFLWVWLLHRPDRLE
jgi:hypothetical protein